MTLSSCIKLREIWVTESQKCVKLQQLETDRNTTVAAIPIPPEVVKTSGENEPCLILPDLFFILSSLLLLIASVTLPIIVGTCLMAVTLWQ